MNLEALQQVLLRAAEAREPEVVLQAAVDGLAQLSGVALARVWLIARSQQRCADCPGGDECPTPGVCLKLTVSAGRSLSGTSWDRVDGDFRTFPLGARKIGIVGRDGTPLCVDTTAGSAWIARPEWARAEGLETMAACPMIFRGETVGVLALFVRRTLTAEELRYFDLFAQGAAVAVANARALAEVERLRKELESENVSLREVLGSGPPDSGIVGSSPAITEMIRQVELVAKTEAAVLILGESGTGKELVAQVVHERSGRRNGPFIKVNCATVPRDLFESEFFGHVRGAFTGALRDRLGRFELASGGTLFLDEIGEVPLELQSKLLRVLQEGTFERVGDERTRRADVRIVAATNRDLRAESLAGSFRQDLYFRLATFPVTIPPLRDRSGDLPALVDHFVARLAARLRVRAPTVDEGVLEVLSSYDWPGNVRELSHVLERAMILGEGKRLALDGVVPRAARPAAPASSAGPTSEVEPKLLTDAEVRSFERDNLARALARADGQVYGPRGAAALLGIPPTTMVSRLRAAGLVAKE